MEMHSGQFSYYCEQCKKGYNEKSNYEAHVATKHKGISFPCNRSDKRFKSESSLKKHLPEHMGQWKYWCNLCQKGFSVKSLFEIDQNKHMGNTFQRTNCNHIFYHEGHLRKHQEKCSQYDVVIRLSSIE